jgi:predicted nucleic acid-binding protein
MSWRSSAPVAQRVSPSIDEKFKKVDLGLVDATIVALAERVGISRVLTIDSDFVAVRFGPGSRQAFELACPLPLSQ